MTCDLAYSGTVNFHCVTPLNESIGAMIDAIVCYHGAWVLEASYPSHLCRDEQQIMLRMTHEDIQFGAHEIALSKQAHRCELASS